MKKLKYMIFGLVAALTILIVPRSAQAAVQTSITRSEAEQRALNMINLNWTYTASKNGVIDPKYGVYVTQPKQFNGLATAEVKGIPYNWGGLDGLNSSSYNEPWSNFIDAVNKGAYIGNVNTDAGFGLIPGTAGIDCSGFVQATFNISDSKISTSTAFNTYFTKIDIKDIKHMDILDKPGDHIVIFDRWGTYNGVYGAYTYESTPDQTYGGIQGTKQYFMSMSTINSGYIPGRYVNIADDTQQSTATTNKTSVPTILPGVFASVTNVTISANYRSNPSLDAGVIGTIPKGTIVYLIDYSSGWYQIKHNGQVGWIKSTLISAIPSGKYVTLVNAYQLNIRSNSTFTSSILGVLTQNQYAEVIDYSSDGIWFKIRINGIEGWASSKYLNYIF